MAFHELYKIESSQGGSPMTCTRCGMQVSEDVTHYREILTNELKIVAVWSECGCIDQNGRNTHDSYWRFTCEGGAEPFRSSMKRA